MATTTYEEEKKRVERPANLVMPTYAPPTNTATQQAQAEADAFYNELRQRYAQAADPAVQAAQDARIQRGRQFWTGANLFANVIANAINANGTANGAPNMTWNDASTQKMYETWKDADARLRAERKEAQQRYDAMGLQQQQMRLAAAQAQDKAALDAYKTNYAAQQEAAKFNLGNQWQDYRTQQTQEYQDKVRQQANQDKIDFYEYQRRHPMPSRSGGGSGRTSTKAATDHSVQLGSIDIPAKDEKEAQRIRRDVANKIVDRMNADIEKRNKEKKINEPKEELIAKPKNDKEAQAIIYQGGDLYDDDADFRKDINGAYGIEDIYAEEEEQPFGEEERRFHPSWGWERSQRPQGLKPKQQQQSPWNFDKL
jgi:hypothetical protein